MPNPVIGLIGASVGSSAVGAISQSKAAGKAADAQTQASAAAIAEQRAAREEMRRLLEPYVAAGGPALQAQQAFVAQQEQSPIFQALARQGEEAILQQASATGGLRGGNTQGALAQFRPAMLNQFLENQYAKLGGMTTLGQQSAAGVGSSGLGVATNIGQLLGQQGAAQAGRAMAQGQAWGNFASNLGGLAGIALGGGFKGGF
jgi:hypothetical protein